jgi:hypothetical protein
VTWKNFSAIGAGDLGVGFVASVAYSGCVVSGFGDWETRAEGSAEYSACQQAIFHEFPLSHFSKNGLSGTAFCLPRPRKTPEKPPLSPHARPTHRQK